ncbi:MAG: hypothetical protein AAF539_11675 [Planctomycetota bacterium]
MSSPRTSRPCDAVVWDGDRPSSPLLLPPTRWEAFVAEFNQTYAAIGLQVEINTQADRETR